MNQPFCSRISSLGMHYLCAKKNDLHGNKGLQTLRSSEQNCGHGRNSQKQPCRATICKHCSDFIQFVFMCACWCMPVCMHTCVPVCGGQRSTLDVLSSSLSLRQSLSEPGVCWLGETGWLISCSPVHGLWAQAAVGFSIQMLETELRSSSLSNKYVIDRTIPSIPHVCLEFLSLCLSFITEKIPFIRFSQFSEAHRAAYGKPRAVRRSYSGNSKCLGHR